MKKYDSQDLENRLNYGSSFNISEVRKRVIKGEVYNLKPPALIKEEEIDSYVKKCERLYRRASDFDLKKEIEICENYLNQVRNYD